MQVALAGLFILALVALVAGPAMARRAGATGSPTIVAAVDAYDTAKGGPSIKLDAWVKGGIHIESQSVKGEKDDKWRISSVKCGDVTVVAMAGGKVVSTAAAMSDQGDPAACVFSLKVPSNIPLSIFAQLGNAQSVGLSSVGKGQDKHVPGYDKVVRSDVVTEKLAPPGALKGMPQSVKLRSGDASNSVALYIKLDN